MESFLLLCDCVAIVLVVLWFVRNETRAPGEPVSGLLRYTQVDRADEVKPAGPGKPGVPRIGAAKPGGPRPGAPRLGGR